MGSEMCIRDRIMPSGFPVDGMSGMDDLTSLLRQLAEDRKEEQDRRESDRELRRQDDERLRAHIFERWIAELLRRVR